MKPDIETCGIPTKSIWKTLSVSFNFTLFFHVLYMNAQKLLHPLINHMHEVLQQLNIRNTVKSLGEIHKIFLRSMRLSLGFFQLFISLNKTRFEIWYLIILFQHRKKGYRENTFHKIWTCSFSKVVKSKAVPHNWNNTTQDKKCV